MGRAQEGEPVSTAFKTLFCPLLKRQHFKDIKCSRLSVSGDDKKSGCRTSEIWRKKLGMAQEGEPVSIPFKTLFCPLLKRQHFKDIKCQNVGIFGVKLLACLSSQASQHVLIFLQSFYILSLSTKVPSILKPSLQNAVNFARKIM